jgi:hypothetical protein
MAKAKPIATEPEKTIEGQFEETPEGWNRYWDTEFRAAREDSGEDWFGIKAFQEKGAKVVKRYRAKKAGSLSANDARINIFPSNIQTQRAILVGNTPKCEVARRFEDSEDDDARVAATMLERILNTGLENESKGFSAVIAKCTEDRLLPGMCGSRVEFSAEFEQIPEIPAKMGPCPACQGSGQVAAPLPMPMQPTVPGMMPPGPSLGDAFGGEPAPCDACQGSGQRELAPAVPAQEKPTNEKAEPVYANWRDQLWNQARTSDELRWWAFSADMGRKQLVEAFGDEGKKIPLSLGKGRGSGENKKDTPWSRARVWEIWSKEYRRVFYRVEGHKRVFWHVDNPEGEDPLGLEDFWPFPLPMMANATTDAYLPTADYDYARDLYDEADELTSRIRGIVKAIKVAGCYDRSNKALGRLLDEACELELIPTSNWAEFMAKGGMAGAFQLLPIQEMVNTVQALVAQRNMVIEQIFQITGLGDIIRGQQTQSETATTSAIKARFASVRLQDLQKEVARYATDLQRIRKEVIAKHFSIETIIEQSCIMRSEDGKDPQRIMRAAQLIKDRHLDFRVVVKPEQISLQDWAQLKQQRSEVLSGLGAYFQSMMPLVQLSMPGGPAAMQPALAFIFRTAQWLVAGMPGASGVESAFDAFVGQVEKLAEQAAQQPPRPPPPDPKLQTAQVKAGAESTKAQLGVAQAVIDAKAHAVKTGLEIQKAQQQHAMGIQTEEAKQRTEALKAMNTVVPGGQP